MNRNMALSIMFRPKINHYLRNHVFGPWKFVKGLIQLNKRYIAPCQIAPSIFIGYVASKMFRR